MKTFTVDVNYKRQALELINMYSFVTEEITDYFQYFFPYTGRQKVQIGLFKGCSHNHNGFYDTHHILALLADDGYRPANLAEMLALQEQFPETQEMYLVALGSKWNEGGKNHSPWSIPGEGKPGLKMKNRNVGGQDYDRFLGVKI